MKKEDSFPDIAIIGGFPRDITYKGISSFNSDIDIIIDCSKESLKKYSDVNGIKKNKMGGYYNTRELNGNSLKIDFWCLEETWTHLNAGIPVESISDCINGVFFSCDQIAYLINKKKLIVSNDYIKNMNERKLKIVVRKNPNPHKNYMRALKYLKQYNLEPDEELQSFIKTMKEHDHL